MSGNRVFTRDGPSRRQSPKPRSDVRLARGPRLREHRRNQHLVCTTPHLDSQSHSRKQVLQKPHFMIEEYVCRRRAVHETIHITGDGLLDPACGTRVSTRAILNPLDRKTATVSPTSTAVFPIVPHARTPPINLSCRYRQTGINERSVATSHSAARLRNAAGAARTCCMRPQPANRDAEKRTAGHRTGTPAITGTGHCASTSSAASGQGRRSTSVAVGRECARGSPSDRPGFDCSGKRRNARSSRSTPCAWHEHTPHVVTGPHLRRHEQRNAGARRPRQRERSRPVPHGRRAWR